MASEGRPHCPVEDCDGDLYREFLTGLNQSTAQMMRLGGLALILGPLVLGAPFFFDYVVRQSAGVGGVIGTLVGFVVPICAGVLLLRHRSQRLAERTEQRRCNKCGTVFAAGSGA